MRHREITSLSASEAFLHLSEPCYRLHREFFIQFGSPASSGLPLGGLSIYLEKIMSKGSSNNSGGGRSGGTGGSRGSSGGGRPANGFPGGNWPSTTGRVSGGGRGNAPSPKGK